MFGVLVVIECRTQLNLHLRQQHLVCPVISLDDAVLGQGVPGPLTRELQRLYLRAARDSAI